MERSRFVGRGENPERTREEMLISYSYGAYHTANPQVMANLTIFVSIHVAPWQNVASQGRDGYFGCHRTRTCLFIFFPPLL